MGTYKNYRCGNCNYSMTNGFKSAGTLDNLTRLGPEYIKCHKCGTKNYTKRLPFNKMNVIEKAWVCFCLFFTYTIYGSLISFMLVGGLAWLVENQKLELDFSQSDFTQMFWITTPLSIGVLSYFQFRKFIRDIKHDGY